MRIFGLTITKTHAQEMLTTERDRLHGEKEAHVRDALNYRNAIHELSKLIEKLLAGEMTDPQKTGAAWMNSGSDEQAAFLVSAVKTMETWEPTGWGKMQTLDIGKNIRNEMEVIDFLKEIVHFAEHYRKEGIAEDTAFENAARKVLG